MIYILRTESIVFNIFDDDFHVRELNLIERLDRNFLNQAQNYRTSILYVVNLK